MNKKALIILLVIVVISMGFLIWFKNGQDINGNLNNNISVQDNSGETISSGSTGGIDINLSGDTQNPAEKENSGDVVLSGEILNNSGEKEPTISTEKENDVNNDQADDKNNSEEVVINGEGSDPILVSDDTKLAFKIGATQIVVYYYEGETITKKEAYIDYKTEDEAKKVAAQYNDGTKSLSDIGNVKSATSQGKYVVMTYNESEYDYLTFSKIKNIYGRYEITK